MTVKRTWTGPTVPGFSYTGPDGLTYVDADAEYKAWAAMFPAAARKAAARPRHWVTDD
jgi:hypothetical protein